MLGQTSKCWVAGVANSAGTVLTASSVWLVVRSELTTNPNGSSGVWLTKPAQGSCIAQRGNPCIIVRAACHRAHGLHLLHVQGALHHLVTCDERQPSLRPERDREHQNRAYDSADYGPLSHARSFILQTFSLSVCDVCHFTPLVLTCIASKCTAVACLRPCITLLRQRTSHETSRSACRRASD